MTDVVGVTYQYVPPSCTKISDIDAGCPGGSTTNCYGCGSDHNQFADTCLYGGSNASSSTYCYGNIVYEAGACGQYNCGEDWYIGQSNNACNISNQHSTCMSTDISQCFNRYLKPDSVSWYTNGNVVPDGSSNNKACPGQTPYTCNNRSSGRPINCKFNLERNFNTVAEITEWKNIYDGYDINDEVYNTIIMPHFCNRPAITDPNNPLYSDDQGCSIYTPIIPTSICGNFCTGTGGIGGTGPCPLHVAMQGNTGMIGGTGIGLTGCSRVNARGPAGQICQDWVAGAVTGGYQDVVDGMMGKFCNRYICSQDCLCLNANKVDPTFISLVSAGAGTNVQTAYPCWYVPCQSSTSELTTSIIQGDLQNCPENICQQVNQVIDTSGTVNQTNNENIYCTQGGGPPQSPYVESIWDQYGLYIIIGFGLLVGIIAIIILIVIISGHKKS